jgi:hypothetical protein
MLYLIGKTRFVDSFYLNLRCLSCHATSSNKLEEIQNKRLACALLGPLIKSCRNMGTGRPPQESWPSASRSDLDRSAIQNRGRGAASGATTLRTSGAGICVSNSNVSWTREPLALHFLFLTGPAGKDNLMQGPQDLVCIEPARTRWL